MGKMEKIQEQMEEQVEVLQKILKKMQEREASPEGVSQQEALANILQHLQTQEALLKKTTEQVEHQQELLNVLLRHVKETPLPPQLKPSFSLLDKLDLDMEKLTNIAIYIANLYNNSNKPQKETDTEAETKHEQ